MSNTFKKNNNSPKKTKKQKVKKNKKNRLNIWFSNFFSGEYLFPKNFSKSPLLFIIYCACLILIYIVLRYEPVKRYNKICELNDVIIQKDARNNKLKSEILLTGSVNSLAEDFDAKDDVDKYRKPIIIKLKNDTEINK
ncbi:MAG: hypothetical protein ACOX4D_05405 [Bacteroidales bacterium]|jgi:hypothetical protein